MAAVEKVAAPHPVAVQAERLGTAHAALCAAPLLVGFGGDVAVLYADNPLIRPATLSRLLAARARADLVPFGDAPGRSRPLWAGGDGCLGPGATHRRMGRRHRGRAGDWLVQRRGGMRRLARSRALAARGGQRQCPRRVLSDGCRGPSRRRGRVVRAVEAPEAEASWHQQPRRIGRRRGRAVQHALRQAAMARGTAHPIAPDTVFFAFDTETGEDTVIHPHVVFGPGVVLQPGAEVRSLQPSRGAVWVERGAVVGPARLRPGTRVEAGGAGGQFRQSEGHPPGPRGEGQPPHLSWRCRGGGGGEHRRRHHHLQLRRVGEAPHRDRRGRLHRQRHCPSGAGARWGGGDHRRRQCHHRRGTGRCAGTWPRPPGGEAGAGHGLSPGRGA